MLYFSKLTANGRWPVSLPNISHRAQQGKTIMSNTALQQIPVHHLETVLNPIVVASAGLTHLPKFHWPRPQSCEPLPVLDFCRLELGQRYVGNWFKIASAPTPLARLAGSIWGLEQGV